jgi:uncharacterized membrane protein
MEALGPFHPQIVHFPVALLLVSVVLSLAGRALDREWLRRAGTSLLVLGFLGAVAATLSGDAAHETPEDVQGVPEAAIEAHEDMAKVAMFLAGGAVVALGLAGRVRAASGALSALALLLQLAAAVAVGVAGHRGGALVYEHGANVRVGGALVRHPGAAAAPASDAAAGGHGQEGREGGREERGERDGR